MLSSLFLLIFAANNANRTLNSENLYLLHIRNAGRFSIFCPSLFCDYDLRTSYQFTNSHRQQFTLYPKYNSRQYHFMGKRA